MSHEKEQRNISHEKSQKAQKEDRSYLGSNSSITDEELAEAMRSEREELEETWAAGVFLIDVCDVPRDQRHTGGIEHWSKPDAHR